MIRRAAALTVAAVLAWVGQLGGPSLGSTPTGSPPVLDEAAREQHLERLRADVRTLEAQLQEVRRTAQGLAGELAGTRVELTLQEKRLAEATAARELAAQQLAASEQRVSQLESALGRARQDLRVRLASLYRLGRWGYLRLLLSMERDADPLQAVRLLRYLARRDSQAIDGFLERRHELRDEHQRLLAEREQVEQWAAQEEQRRHRLDQIRRRQTALLAQLEDERQQLSDRAEQLREKERKLSRLLDILMGRLSAPLAGEPIQQFRGVLDWPADGDVRITFGPQLDPQYHTRLPHNGIDIATRAGSPVRAVYPGQVMYAAVLEGYGTTVVIHHPGRVFSIYSDLAELRAAAGDVVSLADAVGLASDRLYFEIRVENRPEDPQHWLR